MTSMKNVVVEGTGAWQDTGVVTTSSVQRLSIIPHYATGQSYARLIPSYERVGQHGTDTGIWVPKGKKIAIRVANPADYWVFYSQGDGCWSQSANAAGQYNHYVNGEYVFASDMPEPGSGFRLMSAPKYSLIGRIGNGPWQYVGLSAVLTAPNNAGGTLILSMNDNNYQNNFFGYEDDILEVTVQTGAFLRARIGNNPDFIVGAGFDGQAGYTGPIQLRFDESTYGSANVWIMLDAPDAPDNQGGCQFTNIDRPTSTRPVDLQTGEKRLQATDLSVETPAGSLTFDRTYRQSKQEDPNFAHMGLGWTHNHRFKLTLTGSSPNRAAEVILPDGGLLKLAEDSGSAGHFDALSGSTAEMDFQADTFGAGQDGYLLTASDKTIYAFDASTLRLAQCQWPDGEVWTYGYDGSGDLTDIDDGYGRQLRFSYYSTADYKDGQLWRVGDHTASGLATGSPSGRYVEFDYAPEKIDGITVASARALLTSVRDVRGQIWQYSYHGQTSGERDVRILNFVTNIQSPEVDATGDTAADGHVITNRLTYATALDLAVGGDMEVDEGWHLLGNSEEAANELTTAQAASGSHSRYVKFFSGLGLQGEAFDVVAGRTYTVTAKIWRVTGSDHVSMQVTNTSDFDAQTQGSVEQWETLQVMVRPTSSLPDVQLQFLPAGTSAEFYLDSVSIIEDRDLVVNGSMEADAAWSGIVGSEPVTNERSSGQVDAGTYSRHVTADAANEGIESQTFDLKAGTTYILAARVYQVSGAAKIQIAGTASFDGTTASTGTWETLRVVATPSSDITGATLQVIASGGAAEFYIDQASLLPIEPDLAQIIQRRGIWDPASGPEANALETTSFTFRPGGDNMTVEEIAGKQTIHQFVNAMYFGASNPAGGIAPQAINQDYRPQASGDGNGNITNLDWGAGGKLLNGVTDALGGRTVFVYDAAERLHRNRDAEGRETIYLYADDDAPRKPSHILAVKGKNLVVNGGMELDSGWAAITGSEPVSNTRSNLYVTEGNYSRFVSADAAGEGIEGAAFNLASGRTYTIRASVFVVSGVVKMGLTGTASFDRTTSTTSAWETLETSQRVTSGAAGVRLQFTASGGAAEFYVDAVEIIEGVDLIENGGMEIDANWTSVGTPTTNVRDTAMIDTGDFARHVTADAAGEGIQSATFDLAAGQVYAILARVYPVSGTVAMGVSGTSEFNSVTSGAGEWKTLFVYSAPSSALPGATLQFLSSGGAAEFYVDSVAILGQADILRWQVFNYDTLGRLLVETEVNPVDPSANPLRETLRSYYTTGAGDGFLYQLIQTDLSGTNDVTTTYIYDSAGRVVQTNQSAAFGSCTKSYTVYDASGNVVASICNYENSGAAPTTAGEAVALYDPQNPDVNRVTVNEYDPLGRRFKTTADAGSSFAQTTLTVYDALDRVVRTIRNYVSDAGIPNPFIAAQDAFDHGADNTRNLVTDTEYNERGLVRLERDVLGSVTLYGYDDAGRLVRTIQNASDPDYDNSFGPLGDPDLGGYVAVGDADKDIITSQQYDAAGNVVKSIDALGRAAITVYDALNRPVKTIQSPKDEATLDLAPGQAGYSAANDPRSDSYVPSADPDRDLITTTEYDVLGRVIRTRQLLDNRGPAPKWDVTLSGYDELGRQVRTIRSASQPDYDIATDPDLSEYALSGSADKDIVSAIVYGIDGRVLYTEDVNGSKTWQAYDGLGRQVKTIVNAVGTATDGGASDPRSASYTPSTDPDKDLITQTVYDDDGRVRYTVDVKGQKQWNIYDALGRAVKHIQNTTWVSGSPAPEDEDYIGSTDTDKDVITRTIYDAQGRAFAQVDSQGNQTRLEYDILGRLVGTIANYSNGVWSAEHPDLDLISTTEYDVAGRITSSINAAGVETRFEYDALGRRIGGIVNYVDGIFDPAYPDEDVTTLTVYDKGGQVSSAVDARGTATGFTYDHAGRRLTVTRAAGTLLAATSYTCFDKAGRTLRSIEGWTDDGGISPDAQDASGAWLFNPGAHGRFNDRDLITTFALDALGRVTAAADPLGNVTSTAYFKDGAVASTTDALGVVTARRYDGLRRLTRVVQNHVDNGEDPLLWAWNPDEGFEYYQQSNGTPIDHGVDSDQNVIVLIGYDKAGRMVSRRDPRGNETTYDYDLLDRRTELTMLPGDLELERTWATSYENLSGGDGTRATLTDPMGFETQRTFDRLGRPVGIGYLAESPKLTPDVTFSYDQAGNRVLMSETNGASTIRETRFEHDTMRRLVSVGFDEDGDGDVEQIIQYQYDAGGLRTKLAMPGGLEVAYEYNQAGQLVRMSDWAQQGTDYAYDLAGRLMAAEQGNGLRSRYSYDAAGRLSLLRHAGRGKTLGHFAYQTDARGNRVEALECVPHVGTGQTLLASDDKTVEYTSGVWTASGGVRSSTDVDAALRVAFFGTRATLTVSTGPDHGLFEIYVNDKFWRGIDGYKPAAGERNVVILLDGEGPHSLEIRNQQEKNIASTGYKVGFKQMATNRAYDLSTIDYEYDGLSRLLSADYLPGTNIFAVADRTYLYSYDLAGNRLTKSLTIDGGAADATTYTYNALNQMVTDGPNAYTYDANGSLTHTNAVVTHSYDRANRLLSFGGASYAYNGDGQRVGQTVDALAKKYLLDVQPGLWKVLAESDGSDTTRYVHGPLGLQSQQGPDSSWVFPAGDALGSVRAVMDADLLLLENRSYSPYGETFGIAGANSTVFGFTGEPYDSNGLLLLRARYYDAQMARFFQSDPSWQEANLYEYVSSNPITYSDPSGLCGPVCWLLILLGLTGVAGLLTQSKSNALEAEKVNPSVPCPRRVYDVRQPRCFGLSYETQPIYGPAEEVLGPFRDPGFQISQTYSGANALRVGLQAARFERSPYATPIYSVYRANRTLPTVLRGTNATWANELGLHPHTYRFKSSWVSYAGKGAGLVNATGLGVEQSLMSGYTHAGLLLTVGLDVLTCQGCTPQRVASLVLVDTTFGIGTAVLAGAGQGAIVGAIGGPAGAAVGAFAGFVIGFVLWYAFDSTGCRDALVDAVDYTD